MNVSWFIAKRYLFSKKTKSIINIISTISIIGVFVSTAALVIVLSGFNGIDGLVKDIYGKYDADITIVPKFGKTVNKADLIILHTEWDEFKSLDFKKLSLNKNCKVYDLRNLYNYKEMLKKKIKYYSIGRPAIN